MLNYLKSIFLFFLLFFIFLFILTFFYYFNIIGYSLIHIFNIMSLFISLFVSSIYLGMHAKEKGYLEGIKLGVLIIAFLLFVNILLNNLKWSLILYFSIIFLISILGSMIGINYRKD